MSNRQLARIVFHGGKMIAAAAASAIPLSAGAWHLLSKNSSGQSSSNAVSSQQPTAPIDTMESTHSGEPHAVATHGPDDLDRRPIPNSRTRQREKFWLSRCRSKTKWFQLKEMVFVSATKVFPISQIEIVTAKSPSIWIGRNQYRGYVRIFRRPGGRLIAVNILPLEEYLASVLNSEMPASISRRST